MKRDDAKTAAQPPNWRQPDGKPVSCEEKILVLNENLTEIQEACQEALEDAVLMEVDEAQFRAVLTAIIKGLHNPYAKE